MNSTLTDGGVTKLENRIQNARNRIQKAREKKEKMLQLVLLGRLVLQVSLNQKYL